MKTRIILLLALALCLTQGSMAQDIKVKRFEQNPTSIIAKMNPVYTYTEEACAVLRVYVKDKGYNITSSLGVLNMDMSVPGEIRLWVPPGARKLTVRKEGLEPLLGYEIPIRVEASTDYDVVIEASGQDTGNHAYIGAGYHILSLSGPSLTVGANLHHHQIELGAVYGLNKSDDLYFYGANDDLKEGYNYNAVRVSLTYGYEIAVSDFFYITPMAGASYLVYLGKDAANATKSTNYKNGNSISAVGAVRLSLGLGSHFRLCITPEYQAAVYKDKNTKLFSSYDDKMKGWNTGFNLSVGLMVYF